MRQKAINGLTLAAAFLLPAAVMWAVFQHLGFAPAGDRSVLIMDMHNQYAPFFASLRELLEGDATLFFSLQKQMGTGFVGLFAYYVASPLNLLTLLFPTRQLPLALTLLTCLKLGLCGLSMQVYLTQSRRMPVGLALLFSLGYGLMSYNVVYGMCLMWLDAVALTPLTLWGVEKLAAGKKPVWLFGCLVLLFWCDYYIGYMVGLFSILYLCYLLFTRPKETLRPVRAVATLAGTAALAIALLAFYLLPVGLDLTTGKLGSNTWRPDGWYYFAPWELLQKLLPGSYTSITYYGLPSIYCGVLPLAGLLLCLCFRRVPWRTRVGVGALLLILAASFTLTGLDFVWHGFLYPNWFPARYAFLWSFVLVLACGELIARLPLKKWLAGKRRFAGYALCVVLLTGTTAELSYNAATLVRGLDEQFGYKSTAAYEEAYDETAPLVEQLQEWDTGVYRMETTYRWSRNDALLYGYNGITHYSSTYHTDLNRLFGKLGFFRRSSWDANYTSCPVTDALFGVRYVLSKKALPAYSAVARSSTVIAYRNPYALPLGFAADVDVLRWSLPGAADPFAAQESLLTALRGQQTAVWKRPAAVEEATEGATQRFAFTVPADGLVYAALPAGRTGSGSLYVNGTYVSRCLSSNDPNLYCLGELSAGDRVTVTVQKSGNATLASAHFAVLDETALLTEATALAKGGLTGAEWDADTLTGRVTVQPGQVLYLSLPYSEGFTVTADGTPVETYAVGNSLTAACVPVGTHDIRVTYTAPGFTAGLVITLLAVAGLVAAALVAHLRRKWNNEANDLMLRRKGGAVSAAPPHQKGKGRQSGQVDRRRR